jgi:hypothetical protein
MPGGLLQLVGVGAQNQFINGNPSMTYFTSMYKRFTNFAMEHFHLVFNGNDQTLTTVGTKTLRAKVSRYADLLHDCYLCVNLPDIYSPLSADTTSSPTTATPYNFQWIHNIGYNMIQEASVLINGSPVVTITGEWMKIMSYLKHDKARREILDQMIGNVPELYDPANAGIRSNQYPHSIQVPGSIAPAPSIRGRQLVVPLPFWFCEEIGQSLPLVSLTEAEVEISITFKNIYQLFTINDVVQTSPTYNTRIIGEPQSNNYGIQNFLSPPNSQGFPTILTNQNWNLNPYIEANYIFLTETERAHIAGYERTYLISQPRSLPVINQYGYNDVLIPMFNLCTRVVALFQRTDRVLLNDWDNYTNWSDPALPQIALTGQTGPLQFYSAGVNDPSVLLNPDILQEANLVFDGKERFNTKNSNFWKLIENYKYTPGSTSELPGIYHYSFSIDPSKISQPSGSVNGSMFNKTDIVYTLQVPPVVTANQAVQTSVCVIKSTVFNSVPTPAPAGATVPPGPGLPPLVQPGQTILVYNPLTGNNQQYQYNGTIYIEAYNFLKVTSGTANVVFST